MTAIWNLPRIHLMPLAEVDDPRPAALLTSGLAWAAVKDRLKLKVVWHKEISEATLPAWDALLNGFEGEVIYAVGGGLPHDAAKYLGTRMNLPVVSVPTALSVDAFFTWASGIREKGCVRYIETKVPEMMIADLDVIAAAPAGIHAAGIADVLSIATGSWDWQFAHERGENPAGMEFIPYVHAMALDIMEGAFDCAAAAGRGDKGGLRTLLDCLSLEVQLTNQAGHARPEEGSEHYFAYAVENRCGHGRPHGDLLAPGILLMMAAQGQDPGRVKQALSAASVPLNQLDPVDIHETLIELPAYCLKHQLPYGIAHELDKVKLERLDIARILES